jgi:hypothetical protein
MMLWRLKKLFGRRSAQAMTEYAIITAAFLGTMMVLQKYLLPDLIDAYQAYFDQLYFMLNLPIP